MTIEEMLDLVVPAPFVEGQEQMLRYCTIPDINNAVKVLEVTGGNQGLIDLLKRVAHECRNIGTTQLLTVATYDKLHLLAHETQSIPKKKEKKSAKKSS